MNFTGTWHIFQMEMWDEDYFNMKVQAYIKIEPSYLGNFQFGLVQGDIDGIIVDEKLEFSWEGIDENDPLSGIGWLKMMDDDLLQGEFRIHLGDSSTFFARRANK